MVHLRGRSFGMEGHLENRRFTQFLFLSLLPVLSLAPEETSVVEGMTRPSRGQCDAGHVIPPAVLPCLHFICPFAFC